MSTSIDLERPIVVHGDKAPITVSKISFREPGFREVMKFGEPMSRGYATDGSVVYSAENTDVIRGYAEALIEAPADALLLGQLGIADTLKVKDAIIGFFTAARSKLSQGAKTPSKTSVDTSTS